MEIACSLHHLIEKYNVLQKPTQKIDTYFRAHPNVFKVVLIANHLFRVISMVTFMMLLPYSPLATATLCFAGSLFYRLTVEKNCAYKFALPAFAGSMSYVMGKKALMNVISGVAFESFDAFATTLVPLVPLLTYSAYVVLTVSHDVDHRHCSRRRPHLFQMRPPCNSING